MPANPRRPPDWPPPMPRFDRKLPKWLEEHGLWMVPLGGNPPQWLCERRHFSGKRGGCVSYSPIEAAEHFSITFSLPKPKL